MPLSFIKSIAYDWLPIRWLFGPYQFAYNIVSALFETTFDYLSPIPIHKTQKKAEYKWNSVICQEAGFKYPKDADAMIMSNDERAQITPKLQYVLKHAVGIYPPWFLFFCHMLENLLSVLKSTKELVADRFGLDPCGNWLIYPKDENSLIHQKYTPLNFILWSRGNNEKFKPPFYLMRDDNNECFVLCIRGSVSLNDWFTDFWQKKTSKPKRLIDDVKGQVHDGMYRSARWIYDEIIGDIRQIYANQKEQKELIVTGHSLGAGVASLLGLIFLKDAKKNKDIIPHLQVYSFATPSVASQRVCEMELVKKHINSIILNTDIVSRGGTESAELYKQRVVKIQEAADESDAALGSYFAQRPLRTQVSNEEDVLYPVGTVYWFIPKNFENKGTFGLKKIVWSLLFRDPTDYDQCDWKLVLANKNRQIFGELLFDGYELLYAHFPNRYAWAIGLSSTLQSEKNG